MHRSEQKHPVALVPRAQPNANWINEALGGAISQVVADEAPTKFLAKGP
jgi:hypothetical protein